MPLDSAISFTNVVASTCQIGLGGVRSEDKKKVPLSLEIRDGQMINTDFPNFTADSAAAFGLHHRFPIHPSILSDPGSILPTPTALSAGTLPIDLSIQKVDERIN